ncbi:MAG: adenylate/guanylate cyclase domain-containing protein [Geminicoccaceae bacterium]
MVGPDDPKITEIVDWLLGSEARQLPNAAEILKALCPRLNAAGLPVARVSFHVRTLHPQLFGVGFHWYRGRDDIEVFYATHGMRDSEMYLTSPLHLVLDGGAKEIRQSLELPDEAFDYQRYVEIKAEGMTEYLILPLAFSDGKTHASTWSTDKQGGFTDEQVLAIHRLLPIVGLLIEINLNRRISINLLNAYVGHQAGERILAGQITRGSGDTIPAAIWFSDLRGFTALSETRGRDELLGLLNQYFDCMAEPIAERGGEILKFIGDAVLAIFPLTDESACCKALEAAIQAQASLGGLNDDRGKTGAPPLAAGIALHVGDVMYGNIGSANRLDFTVIGPAVNLASRIEGMCKSLDATILVSDDFKDRCPSETALRSFGSHRLKGIEPKVEIFGPGPDADRGGSGVDRET